MVSFCQSVFQSIIYAKWSKERSSPRDALQPQGCVWGCWCPHHCLGIPSADRRVPVLPLSGAGRVVCIGRIGLGWSDLLSFLRWNYNFSEIKTAYAYALHNKNKRNKAPTEITIRVAAFQRRWAVTKESTLERAPMCLFHEIWICFHFQNQDELKKKQILFILLQLHSLVLLEMQWCWWQSIWD